MKFIALAATALTLAVAAPATAQSYNGGTAVFTGVGLQAGYPDPTYDIVNFAPVSGTYAGPGQSYDLNNVSFTAGLNRNDGNPGPFTGVFNVIGGNVGGNPFSYNVGYSINIGTAFDTITLGGNYVNILGQGVHLSTLTLSSDGTTVSGVLSGFAGGVPEPTTWALMIVGFGAVGGAMRRRSAVRTKVAFA